MSNFESFGFSESIVKAITEMGFETPTPIQAQSFPILLGEDTDFLGLAQTGTGKTAAFGLPLLEKIDPSLRKTQGVILSPTRELSQQICQQMNAYTKYLGKVDMVPVFGGASISQQIKEVRKGPQIIVGTPGRFIDLLQRKVINLDHLRYIILDEADEMLNMGFREDIDLILSHVEGEKKTWLFSATMPKEIRRIIKTYMEDPQEVKINQEQKTNENIQHMYAYVQGRDKHSALKRIIDVNPDMYGIVFCKTKRDTEEVSARLTKDGYKADYLNGDLSQSQRDNVMGRFKSGQLNLLVATDVAARGIDVNNLTHVIHFSLPDQLENYTHRSGRTGRAGNKGISLSLISGKDRNRLSYMEKTLSIKVEYYKIPMLKDVAGIRLKHWLEGLLQTDENSLDIDEELETFINDSLKKVTKAALIKKVLAKDTNVGQETNEIEDLNANVNSRGGRDRDRDRGRGRDRDRDGRDRDRGRGRDRDRGGRDRDRDRGRGRGRDSERSFRDRDRDRGRDGGDRDRGRSRDNDRYDRDSRRGDDRRRDDRRSDDRFDRRSEDRGRDRDRSDDRGRDRDRSRGQENTDYGADRNRQQEGMTTFTIDIGSNVLSNKGHLIRLLCDESGLNKSCFGDVNIRGKESTVTVGEDFASEFKSKFKGTRVQGQKVKVAQRGFESFKKDRKK